MSPQYSDEDSQLVSALKALPAKLCKSSIYPAPTCPNILVHSWKLNEFKYYDVPSPFPTLARGLFTTEIQSQSDQEAATASTAGRAKHRIVARGYEKFFNIGEVPWTTWAALETHTAPPYVLSLKSNGCIIFIAALTPQKLLITSKHSIGPVQGANLSHAQAGEQWLRRYLEEKGRTEEQLAKRLWDENWTAVAELCDDSFEEHVLGYPPEKTGLHLHGINVSTKSFKTMPHTVVDSFAEEWGFIKTRTHIVTSIAEVKAFTDQISNEGEWEGERVEGFVVRTHVARPISNSGAKDKTRPPYPPSSSFFFKVKFDEPYMMYRDWRELTKTMLSSFAKGKSLSIEQLPKGKMKRKETKVYVKWAIEQIKKNPKAFDGYTKGHGIIRNRERFLQWLEDRKDGKELNRLEAEVEEETEVNAEGAKVIIVPIAIPGCGKTSVALALAHLFGWGHTQSDDIKAKKSAALPFLRSVSDLLQEHDVVIADKNNHLAQHRSQLRDIATQFTPRARLVALNWTFSHISRDETREICSERIIERGTNHQTLIPVSSSSSKSHEDVLRMFVNQHEKLTSSEVDACVDIPLDRDEDLEQMIGTVIDGLFKVEMLVGPGGALEGIEKPDVARIGGVVRDVVDEYVAEKNDAREKENNNKKEKEQTKKMKKERQKQNKQEKKAIEKGKSPRYFGILPEVNIRDVLDSVFAEDETQEAHKANGAEFWRKLKNQKRVTDRPHITIVHEKELPEDQDIWNKSVALNTVSPALGFECRFGRVLWDGRVMVLVVDNLCLPTSTEDKKAKDFIGSLPQATKDRLHVTVGTTDSGIRPVEGKTLVERWRAGEREDKGVFGVELAGGREDGAVVVSGTLKGLWS